MVKKHIQIILTTDGKTEVFGDPITISEIQEIKKHLNPNQFVIIRTDKFRIDYPKNDGSKDRCD